MLYALVRVQHSCVGGGEIDDLEEDSDDDERMDEATENTEGDDVDVGGLTILGSGTRWHVNILITAPTFCFLRGGGVCSCRGWP